MTAQCPICRSPVEVDDAKIPAEGLKVTCPLCDEVFTVRPASAEKPAAAPSGTRSATPSHASSAGGHTGSGSSPVASASRRLLEEDSGDGAAPRVLVAHDSHAFGDMARTLLEEEGFDVEVVHDGIAALDAIEARTPAVAILEAALPKKFGYQICADIRARAESLPVKLLLVASVYDRRRMSRSPSMAVAPDEFLEPRNVELELVPKVKRLLRGREGTGSRPAAPSTTRSIEVAKEQPPRMPEVLPPEPKKKKDDTHPTHPTMGEADFADLFEETSASRSKSVDLDAARAAPPITDVDAFLAADGSSPGGALPDDPPPRELSAVRAKPKPKMPLRIGDEPIIDSDEREIWERVLAEDDEDASKKADDELLRTLMEMANGGSDEESSSGSDELPFDEVSSAPKKEPLRASGGESGMDLPSDPLDEILDQVSGPKESPREAPRAKPSGNDVLRADDFLSEELPGEDYEPKPSDGSIPDAWKPDAEEKAKPASSTDELDELLGGKPGAIAEDEPDALVDEDEPEGGLDVVTSDDLDVGTELLRGDADELAPRSESSRPTLPIEDDEHPARTRASRGTDEIATDLGGGMIPGVPANTPTVLKKGTTANGTRASKPESELPLDDDEELPKSSPPPVTMGSDDDVLSASDLGADDERSLASARAVRAEDDSELDEFLEGSLGSSEPAEENEPAATRAASVSAQSAPAAKNGGDPAMQAEHEKARRLAKLIVGDILLYNADKIPDAVRSGTFFDVMKGDIKDGREFYDEKVPDAVRAEHDYIQELLEETLARKKKELGLS